jgi:hypothetical protein
LLKEWEEIRGRAERMWTAEKDMELDMGWRCGDWAKKKRVSEKGTNDKTASHKVKGEERRGRSFSWLMWKGDGSGEERRWTKREGNVFDPA